MNSEGSKTSIDTMIGAFARGGWKGVAAAALGLAAGWLTPAAKAAEAATHIGFPPVSIMTKAADFKVWKTPFYVCAEQPQNTAYKPIASFRQGQVPWMHFVLANFGKDAEEVTAIRLDLFDTSGTVVRTWEQKIGLVMKSLDMRDNMLRDPGWKDLKPGVYALRATVNPDRQPASDVIKTTANWGFTVTSASAPAVASAPVAVPPPVATPAPSAVKPTMRKPAAASVKAGGAVATKAGGDFVLIDGQRTRLPVMSCKMPEDCVALGKVIWRNNVADPLRFHIQAVGVADGARSTVSGSFMVSPRNPIGGPAQNPEMSVPTQLAQWASGEICGIYGLQNLRLLSANAVELPRDEANALMNSFAVGARQRGIVFTSSWVREMRFKYSGLMNGKPMVINARFPYFYFVIAGIYVNGVASELGTTCSGAENEQLALGRLEIMRKSQFINQAFVQKLDEIIKGNTDWWIRSNNQMVQTMMSINRDLEDSYARNREATWYSSQRRSDAVDRFCDAIRGEERVTNPTTGREMYVSTEYDHCAVNAFGDQLYWNGSGATANFDPNSNAAFNSVRWGEVK